LTSTARASRARSSATTARRPGPGCGRSCFPRRGRGFGPGGLIEDLKLGLGALIQHHSAFKRIAVVSDMHWVAHALPPSPGWSPASSPCSASTSSSGPRSGPPADSLARPTAARRWAKRVAPPRWPRRPVLKGLNVCDDRRDGRPDNQNPNRNRDGRGDQRHRVQFHFHDSPPQYGSWPYSGQYNPTAAITSAAIAAA
jgi:hypothetical protein